jgi:hypothetical protein
VAKAQRRGRGAGADVRGPGAGGNVRSARFTNLLGDNLISGNSWMPHCLNIFTSGPPPRVYSFVDHWSRSLRVATGRVLFGLTVFRDRFNRICVSKDPSL